MSEQVGESEVKKDSFLLRIKKSFRIGGKKTEEKDSAFGLISGKSDTSQKSNLKYVNLIPASRLKKQTKDKAKSEQNASEEVPQLVNASDEVSTSSSHKQLSENIRLDVGGSCMNSKMFGEDITQSANDEEEQLRLYREIHEVRKQMILKEKQFQEEKLELYKLQLEADSIVEQNSIKE